MAVFCEFISLIILRDSIDKYFPGGWKRFVLELPNRSMSSDGEVVCVSFMNPIDVNIYLDFLKSEGLQFRQSGDREIDDISDLDRFMGHLEERQWLEFGDRVFNEQTHFCGWKKGSLIDTISMPSFSDQVMPHLSPEIFNKRLSYLRTQNGLDIYLDSTYGKGKEFYLPEGMSIEEHYEFYSDWRKERENKRIKKNEKLEEEIDKDLIEKQKAQELIDDEVRRALDKRLEEDRLIQQKKDQEFRKAQEKKAEGDLYAKVAKALNVKTLDRSDPVSVMERLVERALKTGQSKDIEIIEEFWYGDYPSFGFHGDGDDFYVSVDPHEIVVEMKFQWDYELGYEEEEWHELSDEDKFDIFKGRVEARFEENGCCVVKKIGKYFISAYLSDPRENRAYTSFDVHRSPEEVEDLYKNGSDFYNSYSDDTGNCNEQTMRAFFDEHFLKPHHLDDLLGALINKKGIEAATVKFNETIKKTIADDKKPMMYSISIDQLMNDFEEILKENGSQSFEDFKELLEMNLGDYLDGHIALRHHNYVMTADWSMFSECSSFRLFYDDWGMNNYYRDNRHILLSLDEQYPPLNYTDKEMRELYDKCVKKSH